MECVDTGAHHANDDVCICHSHHNKHYAMDTPDYLSPTLPRSQQPERAAQFISKLLNDLVSIYIYFKQDEVFWALTV